MHLDLAFTDPQLKHIEKQDENVENAQIPDGMGRWREETLCKDGASVACLLLIVWRVLRGLPWAWAVAN